MSATVDKEHITFRSSLKVYCHGGIVGLSPDLKPYGGYDNEISLWPEVDYTESEKPYSSPAECVELANLMIARWQEYKARALKETKCPA